jgi:hypothetical protein
MILTSIMEPKLFLSAPAPQIRIVAPALNNFIRYLEKYLF